MGPREVQEVEEDDDDDEESIHDAVEDFEVDRFIDISDEEDEEDEEDDEEDDEGEEVEGEDMITFQAAVTTSPLEQALVTFSEANPLYTGVATANLSTTTPAFAEWRRRVMQPLCLGDNNSSNYNVGGPG